MANKGVTVGSAIAVCIAGFGILFREAVSWAVGKALDVSPLPKLAGGAVNWQAIPWLNTLAIGLLALGVSLFFHGGRMQTAKAEPAPDPYLELTNKAYQIAQYITQYRATKSIFRTDLPELGPTLREGVSAMVSFDKFGFAIPDFGQCDGYQVAGGMECYLGAMAPLLRAGHADVAIASAPKISRDAESVSAQISPQTWWTHRDW